MECSSEIQQIPSGTHCVQELIFPTGTKVFQWSVVLQTLNTEHSQLRFIHFISTWPETSASNRHCWHSSCHLTETLPGPTDQEASSAGFPSKLDYTSFHCLSSVFPLTRLWNNGKSIMPVRQNRRSMLCPNKQNNRAISIMKCEFYSVNVHAACYNTENTDGVSFVGV